MLHCHCIAYQVMLYVSNNSHDIDAHAGRKLHKEQPVQRLHVVHSATTSWAEVALPHICVTQLLMIGPLLYVLLSNTEHRII